MRFVKFSLAIAVFCCLPACLNVKSYVDPQYQFATYNEIKPVSTKHKVNLEVEFQRNGKHFPKVDGQLRNSVEQAFRSTGVVIPSKDRADFTIKVTANNIADIAQAGAKGFATGLTLGLAGTAVTDYYEVTFEFQRGNGDLKIKSYKHAIHTTVGNKAAPVEGEATTPDGAFGKIIEDVVLNFVKDLQTQNILTFNESGKPIRS